MNITEISNGDLISCAGYAMWPSKAIKIHNKWLRLIGAVEDRYMDTTHNGIAVWLDAYELASIDNNYCNQLGKMLPFSDGFMYNGERQLFVIEAVGNGVRIKLLDFIIHDYYMNNGKVYFHRLKDSVGLSRENIVRVAKESLGQPYSHIYQYFLIVLPWLRTIRQWCGRDCDLDGKVCSENAALPYIETGFKSTKPAHLLTPIEVAQWDIFEERIEL